MENILTVHSPLVRGARQQTALSPRAQRGDPKTPRFRILRSRPSPPGIPIKDKHLQCLLLHGDRLAPAALSNFLGTLLSCISPEAGNICDGAMSETWNLNNETLKSLLWH